MPKKLLILRLELIYGTPKNNFIKSIVTMPAGAKVCKNTRDFTKFFFPPLPTELLSKIKSFQSLVDSIFKFLKLS